MRKREANLSIGASTARHMGAGTVKEARDFLGSLDIGSFVNDSEEALNQHLDTTTVEFGKELTCKSWGAARKFLNIFLRGALYNRCLCDCYGLAILEPFLETPLDSHVATALRSRCNEEEGGLLLPPWGTIIRLEKDVSQKYQEVASRVARKKGVARVHLDVWYWRQDKSEDCQV